MSARISNSVRGGLPYLTELGRLRDNYSDEEICRANNIRSPLDSLIGARGTVPDFSFLPQKAPRAPMVAGPGRFNTSAGLTMDDAEFILGLDDLRMVRKLILDGLGDDDIADEQFTTTELVAVVRKDMRL